MAVNGVLRRLGQRVHNLRVDAGMTQEALAAKISLTWHYISAIERGTKGATIETLVAISGALNVTLSELFLDVDVPLPPSLERITKALAARSVDAQAAILRIVEDALALAELTARPLPPNGSRTRPSPSSGSRPKSTK